MTPPGIYEGTSVAVEEFDFKMEVKMLLKLRDEIVTIQFDLPKSENSQNDR